ncbi:MAG: hypothetical protein PHS31_04260, partial [Victivallaceae bacterium]|nr:hypothetical protein [Victivallaceae bacterium]
MRHNKLTQHVEKAKQPYCPFKKFCIFLNGEDPSRVLVQREYLSNRVDELEFAMAIANHEALKL